MFPTSLPMVPTSVCGSGAARVELRLKGIHDQLITEAASVSPLSPPCNSGQSFVCILHRLRRTSFGVIRLCLLLEGTVAHKLCEVISMAGGRLSRTSKIDRARRNTLKSVGLVAGAVVATGLVTKSGIGGNLP